MNVVTGIGKHSVQETPRVGRTPIAVARWSREVTQLEVALAVGISERQYRMIERDGYLPSPGVQAALARYFGVAPGVLFPDGAGGH